MNETPRPGGARAGGHGPEASASVPPGGARAGGGEVTISVIAAAVGKTVALPIEPAKSLLTRRDASREEKRQRLAEEGFIIGWAGFAGSMGGMLYGPRAGVVCALIAANWAAWRVDRRPGG
jgi:hypothetical protein